MPDWLIFLGFLVGAVLFACGMAAFFVGIAGALGAYDDDFW